MDLAEGHMKLHIYLEVQFQKVLLFAQVMGLMGLSMSMFPLYSQLVSFQLMTVPEKDKYGERKLV